MSGLRQKPIGVFDSGIGGLTVVRALTQCFPHENIVYFGDTARVPYGSKSPQVVREYAAQDIDFLLGNDVKMVVVACNTVSAVALDVVQKRARMPVVGVIVPGAAAAVAATLKKRIGIIGTRATVNSKAYAHAVRQIAPDVQVFSQACPLFVSLAEEGWNDHQATDLIAREYLFPLTLEKIDTLILGCTHYPVLRRAIALSDGCRCDADRFRRSHRRRSGTGPRCARSPQSERTETQPAVFVSDIPAKFTEVGERFLGQRMGLVRRAPVGGT